MYEPIRTQPLRTRGAARDTAAHEAGAAALHRRAHTLAGRVLLVAASRQDTATAMLACRRMDAHTEALEAPAVAARPGRGGRDGQGRESALRRGR